MVVFEGNQQDISRDETIHHPSDCQIVLQTEVFDYEFNVPLKQYRLLIANTYNANKISGCRRGLRIVD